MPTSQNPNVNKKDFSTIIKLFCLLLILSGIGFFLLKQFFKKQENLRIVQNMNLNIQIPIISENSDEPPLKLKGIGVHLDYYDPKTNKAGDFEFTKNNLNQKRLWMDYGYVIPANMSASGSNKANPQPTFLLPMGTKVRSLVDGVVVEIPKLYSGDYSIQISNDTSSRWRYETEHVINPVVKVGDIVKADQIIAEVSPHDSAHNNGFGLVEIGILKGGGEGPPEHVCPFTYLDPSVKEDFEKKIVAFYKAWEDYRGDTALYNEGSMLIPGCLALTPIEG